MKHPTKHPVWGLLTCMDLHGCNASKIGSGDEIAEYLGLLHRVIKADPNGLYPTIENFGDETTLMQMLRGGSIVGHFDLKDDRAFINVFYREHYDTRDVQTLTKDFFEAGDCLTNTYIRR